jgi:hypothetical protein
VVLLQHFVAQRLEPRDIWVLVLLLRLHIQRFFPWGSDDKNDMVAMSSFLALSFFYFRRPLEVRRVQPRV